jgi:hypothetical protein
MGLSHIAICVPSFGPWTIEFRRLFIQFLVNNLKNPKFDCCYIESNRTYRHQARESLCEGAIELKADYIFFVDTDSALPFDAIEKLLAHKKDIVSGVYHQRVPPYTRIAYQWTGDVLDTKNFRLDRSMCPLGGDLDEKPIKVGCIGMGCALIKTEVLSRIPKPWFLVGSEFTDKLMGEDVYFCLQAHKAGIEIWIDPTVKVGHITDIPVIVTPDNYKELQGNGGGDSNAGTTATGSTIHRAVPRRLGQTLCPESGLR